MVKRTVEVLNAFTKSYKLRYVVHAYQPNNPTTLCGRQILVASDETFDEEAEGACLKCLNSLAIERRTHPGWVS